jgi:CheY-like chemotaxis protein
VQVLSNLLNNAAKYSEPGKRVVLTASLLSPPAAPAAVQLAVRDQGIGIPSDLLDRIFVPFMQGQEASSRTPGGLGIGLWLVKRIVELHGGTVSASSPGRGRGSEFGVRLPCIAPAAGDAPAAGPEHGGEGGERRRRVLVVDDNRDSVETMSLLLRKMGNEVVTAYDGEEAVAAAAAFAPDLVFMDIGLPKLDGYAAACRIRQAAGARPVVLVAVTGWGQDEHRRRAREAGFDVHLVKPVQPAALARILAGNVDVTPRG